MGMIALYRIETFCGMVWTGGGFSYDEADAVEFDTDDEALEEIETLGLLDVYAERFERYSSVPAPKIYAATEARNAA
jgi:hypothetical protein